MKKSKVIVDFIMKYASDIGLIIALLFIVRELPIYLKCIICIPLLVLDILLQYIGHKIISEKNSRILKTIGVAVEILILAISIVFWINESYKTGRGYITLWGAEDTLLFYGSFLGFSGALVLGIFLYIRDIKIQARKTKIDVLILCNILKYAKVGLRSLMPESKERIKEIQYDKEWKKYLYGLTEIDSENILMFIDSINCLFNCIELINGQIKNNNIDNAMIYYGIYKYGVDTEDNGIPYERLINALYEISMDNFTSSYLPIDKAYNDKKIEEISLAYFQSVENWIYNRIINDSNKNITFYMYYTQLSAWLKANIKCKSEKDESYYDIKDDRVIAQIINKILDDVNTKSKKIKMNKDMMFTLSSPLTN